MSPRPDPAGSFFERVWAVVAQIPPGRVTTPTVVGMGCDTTYGDIAEHLGRRGAARTVGWALNEAVGSDLPCHRVVNRNGVLTGKRHFERCHYPVPTTVGDAPGHGGAAPQRRGSPSRAPIGSLSGSTGGRQERTVLERS